METALQQMKELVKILNKAAKAYYQEDREIMDNREYDSLYDQLEKLEKETGITLADSPTVNVGYEAVDFLPKETHESPMLSLDKNEGQRNSQRIYRKPQNTIILENGRADHCPYLRKWRTSKSCYQRKRYRR